MYKLKLLCRPLIDLRAFQSLVDQSVINAADSLRGPPTSKFAKLLDEVTGFEAGLSYLHYVIYFEMTQQMFCELVSSNLPLKFVANGDGMLIRGVVSSDHETLVSLGDSEFARAVAQLIRS